MAGEDAKFTAFVRKLRCRACFGEGPCHAHHHTEGPTVAPGEPQGPKQLGGKRGRGQRAHDWFQLPLHTKCHAQLHEFRGPFEGMSLAERAAWQDEQIRIVHELYDEACAELGESSATAAPGPTGVVPVPSSLDAFEPEAAAAEFCSAYDLAPQVEHDLARLLRRAVKAAQEGRV